MQTIIHNLKQAKKPLIIISMIFIVVGMIVTKIGIGLNQSPSLSGRVFLIVKGTLPKKRFDRVVFKSVDEINDINQNGSKYPTAYKSKVKEVVGFSGDIISVKKANGITHIYINEQNYGIIKEFSLKGEKLYPIVEANNSLVIPQGYYFVHTPHKDSYDSRYKAIGLIHKSQILGRAYEIL